MKRIILAGALVIASVGLASAQVDIDVGRGGVHVGPNYRDYDRDDWRWRHRRETYGFGRGDCRVVERRIWRDGERLVVRRRICD